MARRLYVLNGPNLNMLGRREPELYGHATLADIRSECERVADELDFDLFFAQSNAEHELIEWLHDAYRENATVVINPAGLSFRSIPLLDALRMLDAPIVEIHITNIHTRDAAHRNSLVSSVARAVIAGAGAFGYVLAIRAADQLTREGKRDEAEREARERFQRFRFQRFCDEQGITVLEATSG